MTDDNPHTVAEGDERLTPIMPMLREMRAELGYRDIPPVMSEPMYDLQQPPPVGAIGIPAVESAAATARAAGGWCAPTEAERWQWLTDAERAAEVAQARADADRHGHDYITVGGMPLPHPAPFSDGMWDLPAVKIDVNTVAFQAHMAEARARIGDVAAAIGAAFERINGGLAPALAALGKALDDREDTPPITDADTALIALDRAERTQIINHPDKPTRRHAKTRYLQVRRHLPREHRRRLKSVSMNQFGALS